MDSTYFRPFIGKAYQVTRTLIMSESAYDWQEGGKLVTPPPSHPKDSLLHWIKNFGKQAYFTSMGRALCETQAPTLAELIREWNRYAYSIYVQGSVGVGARRRPTRSQFKDAGPHFVRLLNRLTPRPLRVIVTGKTMWSEMPESYSMLLPDIQAYKLNDGTLVWCLALPHPSNCTQGFRWKEVGESIRIFTATKFPLRP